MQIIIHRINKIDELIKIPSKYGVEVDIRAYGNKLILNHEPFVSGDDFEEYLKSFHHSFIILNIKETGIEDKTLKLLHKYGINNFFLLDVEFPYIYRALKEGNRDIAIRYSEKEPIEQVIALNGKFDWVWIDTNTLLPLDKNTIKKLEGIKVCLVCPERWGRPEDIEIYIKKMKALNFKPNAVMTAFKFVNLWEKYE